MSLENTDAQTRAGFTAIIGAPNAGKSTLVNALVGEKVTIVTHKVQTTRFQLRGIALFNNTQVVLVDTPGIFNPRDRLDRSMVHAAWTGTKDASAIIHVVDAPAYLRVINGDEPSSQDKLGRKDTDRVIEGLKKRAGGETAIWLALNKVDLIDHGDLLQLVSHFQKIDVFNEVFLISATNGEGLGALKNALETAMPEGPWLYPADQAADIPTRLIAAEVTREKLFLRLHDELPYNSSVETENWQENRDGSVKIEQIIYVRKKSQKPIVLGKGGQTIKAIGAASRADLSEWLGRKVHLFLFVKVRENWMEERERYTEFGLEFDV
ncbi:MAG: GTPase Era [Robiginitomaculum sp.]